MARREKGAAEADIERLGKFLQRPRTLDAMQKHLHGASRRTVHRYLSALHDGGISVIRLGVSRPTQYQAL